ncbi:uncharacterized protein LOC128986910 [Macrosteles quadrilineatus]|uniref:uncharacterized protein LOC128986909 n=1 Tax=Macrosteles quadrilineatus TaxID=74068 RepID=UPI0023E0AFB6|nr:uncharacterized protein LOC128986909 [Macrosteles quadrilineatus]XP_054263494.1 uncharacterized protein LOC128986910 [Macrosteles quadrilineatus]
MKSYLVIILVIYWMGTEAAEETGGSSAVAENKGGTDDKATGTVAAEETGGSSAVAENKEGTDDKATKTQGVNRYLVPDFKKMAELRKQHSKTGSGASDVSPSGEEEVKSDDSTSPPAGDAPK